MARKDLLYAFLAIILGVLAGLYYAWFINPVQYYQTAPATMREDYRQEYILLAASAYQSTGDLVAARLRLAQLDLPDTIQFLEQVAAGGDSANTHAYERTAAASLIDALNNGVRAADVVIQIGNTPTPISTPASLSTQPAATLQPTATEQLLSHFKLVDQQLICDPLNPAGLLQVRMQEDDGQPVPAVEIMVSWESGFSRFFSGLKPEFGLDYADFILVAETSYRVTVAGGDFTLSGLQLEQCSDENSESYPASWLLLFQRTPLETE